MKIGINTLFFRHPTSGTGQYLLHLLNSLARVDQKNEYILIGPDPLSGTSQQLLQAQFPLKISPAPRLAARNASTEKLAWEQFTAPTAARKAQVDVFHVPHFAPPLFPTTPVVVTIHDVIPLRLPLYHTNARTRAYMNVVARAAHKATLIITISQHAKQDIMDVLQLPAERIRVIYEAAGTEYQPVTATAKLAEVRARYGLRPDGRYVLNIGGLDARKNVAQLIRAFAHVYRQLDAPDLQLLIAGNPDRQRDPLFPDPRPVAAELGITEHVIFHFIEEEDKPAIYSGAEVFVFPSLYEGFGLPPLEAMSCGAPVICSNRTSLPEVVGDAALLVDPDNIQEMAQALENVLTRAELSADLRACSLQQARRFDWDRTARETVAAYEETYSRKRS